MKALVIFCLLPPLSSLAVILIRLVTLVKLYQFNSSRYAIDVLTYQVLEDCESFHGHSKRGTSTKLQLVNGRGIGGCSKKSFHSRCKKVQLDGPLRLCGMSVKRILALSLVVIAMYTTCCYYYFTNKKTFAINFVACVVDMTICSLILVVTHDDMYEIKKMMITQNLD